VAGTVAVLGTECSLPTIVEALAAGKPLGRSTTLEGFFTLENACVSWLIAPLPILLGLMADGKLGLTL
jgi:hypothetical protein